MAIPMVKATYALDPESVATLESMARRWGTSKSAALRRAIRIAASTMSPEAEDSLRALDELQQSMGLVAEDAVRWERAIRAERRARSSRRR